ncbi:hypothetical protein WOLCODRAFT_136348 [Wolfiporia cocos MD-104 SS10]|uniref:Uncharacterized protein n=1 Tax=Wolfiporia cocos (strain MD-104) TaxID=742152 RepID=A0A2H3JRF0_WOLCO|nr:hypothetical protein WOLCODRAFT_136348 [Wolfiporia cocos MD-104 SS10]
MAESVYDEASGGTKDQHFGDHHHEYELCTMQLSFSDCWMMLHNHAHRDRRDVLGVLTPTVCTYRPSQSSARRRSAFRNGSTLLGLRYSYWISLQSVRGET